MHLFTILSWVLLALDGLLGLLVMHRRWRRAARLDRPPTPAMLPLAIGGRGR